MDLSLIKNKLDSFQSKGEKREKIDYTKIFWKPKAGKYQIRIVPSKFNKSTPFREIYFHYGYTKGPILALTNWGEADPIVEAAQKLRKSDNPDHWQMAKKITPKMRIFAPVIVRGEEQMGVRLWEFGKELYTQLMNIAMNEDYGDYTDIQDGRDFVIEAVEADIAGRKGIKCNLTPRVKTSPLSDDANAITGRSIEASGRYARRISSEHAALPAAAAAAPAAEPAACRLSASCAAGRDRGRRLLCPI